MDNNSNRICVLCNKKIKRFSKWNDNVNRAVHRKCWLNFRDFGDRYSDFLFCGDKKEQRKVMKVKPTMEENFKKIDEDIEKTKEVIDIAGNSLLLK
jgi:hypothetical protein